MFPIPKQVMWLLEQFETAGYSCYLVGGCVRDFLSARKVHDYDFTTDALPQEMTAFLTKQPCTLINTGIQYGTLTVIYQQLRMEITTYRVEQAYQNHRSPKQFTFTDHLVDDLARRDFTINAMAYHPKTGIIDPFHGQLDIQKRIIRCVGNSEQRFQEDALRILRALRFQFTLHFALDEACHNAVIQYASLLHHISQERIQAEFQQMLMSDCENLLQILHDDHVLDDIVPHISDIYEVTQESKWHLYDVFIHTDIALNHTKGFSLIEKLAVLFHDFGKAKCKKIDSSGIAHFPNHPFISAQIARQALYEMKYPKKSIALICTFIVLHDDYIKADEQFLRRLLAKLDMNYDQAFSLIKIQYADACAKNLKYANAQLQELKKAESILMNMKQAGFSLKRKDLAINGHDVSAHGFCGSEIKEALDWLYLQVIDQNVENQKDALLKALDHYKKRL